jgi:hypothetical protein
MINMYKVLDVREIVTINGGSTSNGIYGGSGSYSVNSTHYTVVIAEDEQGERTRFTFYPASKEVFLGQTLHYGTAGDYDLLVPGDLFELKLEVDTWPEVKLIKEN